MRKNSGFGLIELIIIVAVLSILFAIFAPASSKPSYVVCTSTLDGSVIKSGPSTQWIHSTQSDAWDDNVKMGSFSPRSGDNCELKTDKN